MQKILAKKHVTQNAAHQFLHLGVWTTLAQSQITIQLFTWVQK